MSRRYDANMKPIAGATRYSRLLVIGAVVVCSGCQRYVAVQQSPRQPAGDVRITLTDDATYVQRTPLGSNIRQLEGRVLQVNDSSVAIAVTELTRRAGLSESWHGETVVVPRRDVALLEKQTLSVPRTLATVGAMLAGSFAVRRGLNTGESTNTRTPKPGGGN